MKYLTIVYRLPDNFDASTLMQHEFASASAWSHKMNECDELKAAAKEAAEHLRNEAVELKYTHTTASGEWDGTEPEVQAYCERLIALADRLQTNA